MAIRPPPQLDEELIPSIFRRRGMPVQAQVGPPGNMMMPTQDPLAAQPQAALGNVLGGNTPTQPVPPPISLPNINPQVQQPPVPEPVEMQPTPAPTAPNVLAPPEANALSAPELYRQPSTSGQPMDEYAARAGRRVTTDKRGRPIANLGMQGDEQTLDYYDRLARMQPDKKGGGWWPRIRAALVGFAAGGPIGAAAGFGTHLLKEKFDPESASREYKREKMGELAPAVESIYARRKEARAEAQAESQSQYNQARTWKILNPGKKWTIKQREDGVFVPVDEMGKDPEGKSVKGRLPAGASEWGTVTNDAGELVVFNKMSGLDQSGNKIKTKSLIRQPDGSYVSADTVYERETKTGQANVENAGIDEVIRAAREEQKKIDDQLTPMIKNIPPTIEVDNPDVEVPDPDTPPTKINPRPTKPGKKTIANPAYKPVEEGLRRRQQLDDQIRAAEKGRKYVPTAPEGSGGQRNRKYNVSGYLD